MKKAKRVRLQNNISVLVKDQYPVNVFVIIFLQTYTLQKDTFYNSFKAFFYISLMHCENVCHCVKYH